MNDEDEAQRQIHEMLADELLSLFYRLETLERSNGLSGSATTQGFPSMERLPPLRTSAELDSAMDILKERVTLLESLYKDS
jgi:hypothetical protein